jgi:hypothetical protein
VKKLVSISLVLLLLFNAMGFYTIFIGLEYKNEARLLQSFDNDSYDLNNTITIKVPVSIPYASNQEEFERVNGEFNYQGYSYRMVKQKYAMDTLHIICVKDVEGKRIHQALGDYVKNLVGQAPVTKGNGKVVLSFLKDYFQPLFAVVHTCTGWSSTIQLHSANSNFLSFYFADIVHPPERA